MKAVQKKQITRYSAIMDEFKNRKPIELDEEIGKFWKAIEENGYELVKRLFYMERTGNWRKIEGYQKQTFKVYLDEHLHIPYNRYRQLLYAWTWYPEEAEKYGPHVIQTIEEKVGRKNVDKVLKEFKIHDPKTREAREKIIARFVPVKPTAFPVDTKSYYRERLGKTEEDLKATRIEVTEHEKQIAKLKETVNARDAEILRLKAENEELRKRLEAFSGVQDWLRSGLSIVEQVPAGVS